METNARARGRRLETTRRAVLGSAFRRVGLLLPAVNCTLTCRRPGGTEFPLNRPLQKALSEFVRQNKPSLPAFVELIRGQTADDYRPNKLMSPAVIEAVCACYPQLERLKSIVAEGVRVHVKKSLDRQNARPASQGSARLQLSVLRKNIRNEQDARRCLVLDKVILEIWPELFFSRFGVVDKANGDPMLTGRTIHDLSYPENFSVNDHTNQASIPRPEYVHCNAIAAEILRVTHSYPDADVEIMAGDVAAAFRNVSIHSESVCWFAGLIEEEGALVVDLCCPFGWTGSPGYYEIVGGAITHVHGAYTNAEYPNGFFNYHWEDDHVNVTADGETNRADIERSLRFAMASVLGAGAVNEDKLTS